MPILYIPVENADELLNTSFLGSGALGRVERSATGGGSGYSEVTTFALVSGTRLYTVYDLSGADSSWYRVRFSKSDGSSPSSYGEEFQAGDETGGLLCSVQDVWQIVGDGTMTANVGESILENIRQVSRQIENYCGRWFVPRPSSGTTTYRFHTEYGFSLWIPRGIRSITTLGVAEEDQPDSGGTYTTLASTDYYIDPPTGERTDPTNDPGFWVRLRSQATTWFVDATFGAQITGAFGYARAPYDIQGVAARATVRKYIGKGGAVTAVGPNGTELLLPDMSGSDRAVLDWYKRR